MVRGFSYRFYPTPEQEILLAQTFGCVRYVYNWALNMRTQAWYESQERINYAQTSSRLTDLKKQPETIWLNDVSSVPTQQTLRHLQTAFVNFWEKRNGYPTFKKRDGRQSAEFTRSAFTFEKRVLNIARIGDLRIKWSRRFRGAPSTVHLSKNPAGRYFVSFRVDEPLRRMPKAKRNSVGIDFGLTAFATTSEGAKFQAPKPLKKRAKQLKRAQKCLARKQKGSANRKKAKLRVAKIHQKVADTRKDFIHKFTTKVVRENQAIYVEDLNIRGMMANHCLAKAFADVGIRMAIQFLEYKAGWYGRTFGKVDRFYPSTKRMSCCGHIQNVALSERVVICRKCGTVHDRDHNAAININAEGHSVTACGDAVRPPRSRERKRQASLKQESHAL